MDIPGVRPHNYVAENEPMLIYGDAYITRAKN